MGHQMKRLISGISLAIFVSGCATSPDNITAAYVSPMQYSSYSCPQLREEASRVSARAAHGDPMPLLNEFTFVNKLAKFTGLESRMLGSIKYLENLPLNSAQTTTHERLSAWEKH